jgi:L-threonylcarbamoyladenylate synthase
MSVDLKSVEVIKQGGIILHKTDTVWGLACDAKNEKAVERIREIKNRPDHKSFIVLISSVNQLSQYVQNVPDIAWDLVEFAEKPLTIVYKGAKNLPQSVFAADGSIAIRLVKEGPCHALIHKMERGIISTSANLSGEPTPAIFVDIQDVIKNAVDYIEPWAGTDIANVPSTIMSLEVDGTFTFIRK